MSVDKALQTMIDNMPEKTGKSLEDWKKVLAKQSFTKHSEAVKFLKGEHGVTHGFANTIVSLSKTDDKTDVDLVAAQYKGKETLMPIYESLLSTITQFGNDITITPKKTSVSCIRKRQFVLIKPATKTRIDLGLKIKDQEPEGLLENSGPFGTMCTHRIKIEKIEDINKEVVSWMQAAYAQSV
jgi:predicted transport protein